MSHSERDSIRDADRLPGSGESRGSSDSQTDQLDSGRRRLVKGAAIAAPAIFTLPTGANAGAFGSFAQCVRNTDDEPKYLHTGRKGKWAGDWVNGIIVAKIVDMSYGTPEFDWTDKHALVKYEYGYFDERGRSWSVHYWDQYRYFTCDYWRISGKFGIVDRTSRYTVGWFQDSGELVGYDYSDKRSGRAIYQSCWISILPKAT